MQVYQSGDHSKVLVSGAVAYQIFLQPVFYDRVLQIALELLTGLDTEPVTVILTGGELYRYTPLDYHSRMVGLDPSAFTIEWEVITCFNHYRMETVIPGIRANLHKFLWDILKGIFGLRVYGFSHGDVCLDNIGIRRNHYVLFDYNLSRPYSAVNLTRDLHALTRSVRYHLRDSTLTADEEEVLRVVQYLWSLEDYLIYIQERYNLSSSLEAAIKLDETPLMCLSALIPPNE